MSGFIGIRPATRDDIPRMCEVLVRSITELCEQDHQNDPEHLASWTKNKTPEGLSAWFDYPSFVMRLKVADDKIVAVGGYSTSGRIDVLYVSPDARGAGHSAQLLRAMEKEMFELGISVATLTSTKTALGFYKKHGWQDSGQVVPCHSVTGHALEKHLSP